MLPAQWCLSFLVIDTACGKSLISAGPPPTTLPLLVLPSGVWPHSTSARFTEHSVKAIHSALLSTNSEILMVSGVFLPLYCQKVVHLGKQALS